MCIMLTILPDSQLNAAQRHVWWGSGAMTDGVLVVHEPQNGRQRGYGR